MNDEMRENLHSSFVHCFKSFNGMDSKCEDEIIVTSWDIMRNWVKNDQFCPQKSLASPLKSFLYDYIKLQSKNQPFELNENNCANY